MNDVISKEMLVEILSENCDANDIIEDIQKLINYNIDNGIHIPTKEQQIAIACSLTGKSMKINAFSGSGKTSTLVEITKARPEKKFLYLTFNKAAAVDAQSRFPESNVECRTIHSLAFQAVGKRYADRLGNINGYALTKIIKLGSARYFRNKPFLKGNFVLSTIKRYCQSADDEINIYHTPYVDMKKVVDDDDFDAAQFDLVKWAKEVWKAIFAPGSKIQVSHDMYLKVFSLLKPKIHADVMLIDEAQDSNPITLQITKQFDGQVIFVGDTFQSLYHWRGAIDAMSKIKTEYTCTITQSFRFGQKLADVANDILNYYHPDTNNDIKIKGFEKVDTEIKKIDNTPDAILTRTNMGVFQAIIKYIDKYKIYITGGERGKSGAIPLINKIQAFVDLKNNKKTYHPDLKLFENWGQMIEFSETDLGGDLKVFVKLIDVYGSQRLLDILDNIQDDEKNADIIISTGHKSKGLEWDTVKLWNDFFHPNNETGLLPAGEACLLYVSATRAKKVLDITECMVANPKKFHKVMGITKE